MAILPKSGRVTIAESILERPIHVAWGLGDGSWTVPPAEDNNATSLTTEVGRRVATDVGYVTPSITGEIVLASGRYTRTPNPTNHLYVRAQFEFADAATETIRELGVFVGGQAQPSVPPGQQYFQPSEILDPGRLLHLENLEPIIRSLTTRESFEVVVTF